MQHIKNRLSNQKGSIMIMVAVSIVVILSFLILAVDMPMVMLAKTQLQNAADAGALAGAIAFANTPNSQGRPQKIANAQAEAITIAGLDSAIQNNNRRPVAITAADVTVDAGDTIWITTHRTHATGDALTQHFLKLVNPASDNLTDVTAHAGALVASICGDTCMKPWCIPDRWNDTPSHDSIWTPGRDIYDPVTTGYTANTDAGTYILLKYTDWKAGNFRPGWYGAVEYPPVNRGNPDPGGNNYRNWIGGCEPYDVQIGDTLLILMGNKQGPTKQGLKDLIDLDPHAYWDPTTRQVLGSAFEVSPRCVRVPCFDPRIGVINGKYLEIIKIIVVFVDNYNSGGDVSGYFVRMLDTGGDPCNLNEPGGGFVYNPALVR
jgi:Flp pilus assembly protein TadG